MDSKIKGKKIIKETQTIQTDNNGKVTSFEQIQERFIPREEPDFIKLYLDHVLVHQDLSVKLSPMLVQICKLANYADHAQGGMMIFLNSYTKEQIRNKLNYTSVKMVEKSITSLVSNKILLRKGRGAYLLNPYYFGKGYWEDIKQIRATIDFNTGEFIPQLKFDIRDGSGKVIEGVFQDENGNIVNAETGEILQSNIYSGTEG